MRVYQQMVDMENNKTSENGFKSETKSNQSKPKNKGNPKSVAQKEENDRKNGKIEDKNGLKDSDNDLEVLPEENQRLRQLVDKYKCESINIINKASEFKARDKTSVMEILELMKLNTYLISQLPDSERILEEYMTKNSKSIAKSQYNRKDESTSAKGSTTAPFKSPVQSISNYFKRVDKTEVRNGRERNDSDSEIEDLTAPSTSSSNGRKKNKVKSTPTRTSPRKTQKRTVDTESDGNEDIEPSTPKRGNTPRKSVSTSRKSLSENKSIGLNEKPKRKRRPRIEEPKGLFPCTFDPKQCDEIMDTKAHYDFHMSGHYDAEYVCPFCAYTGPTIQIIKRHINKERETAIEAAEKGQKLTEDKKCHKDIKVYQCFGCKVCNKIHDKMAKKCQHIIEDKVNHCDFTHDMDYEFKDHLKTTHFADTFKNIKNADERKQKVRTIVDKFVEVMYFKNNAKKELLIEKFKKSMIDNKEGEEDSEDQKNKKSDHKSSKQEKGESDSDSGWD